MEKKNKTSIIDDVIELREKHGHEPQYKFHPPTDEEIEELADDAYKEVRK